MDPIAHPGRLSSSSAVDDGREECDGFATDVHDDDEIIVGNREKCGGYGLKRFHSVQQAMVAITLRPSIL